MSRAVLLYTIAVLAAEIIALSYAIPIAVNYPVNTLRAAILYQTASFLSVFSRLIFSLYFVVSAGMVPPHIYSLCAIIDFVSISTIMLMLPRIVHGYFDLPFPRRLYFIAIIQPLIMLYSLSNRYNPLWWNILMGTTLASVPFYISHLYCLGLMAAGFFRPKIFQRKLLVYGFVLGIVYLVPGFIDCFWPLFPKLHAQKPAGLSFSLISPLLVSVIVARYSYPYLVRMGRRDRSAACVGLERFAFTSREEEVLHLIIAGYTNDQIAANLQISCSTVKKHVYNMFQKTSSENRIDLINSCRENSAALTSAPP